MIRQGTETLNISDRWPVWAHYAVTLAAVATALFARWMLGPWLGERAPMGTLFLVLLPLMLVVRQAPFVIGAVSGLVGAYYLFAPPQRSFQFKNIESTLQFSLGAMAILAAFVTIWLVNRAQSRAQRAHDKLQE